MLLLKLIAIVERSAMFSSSPRVAPQVFAVACVAFEALAVLCAISIECINPHTGNGIRVRFAAYDTT